MGVERPFGDFLIFLLLALRPAINLATPWRLLWLGVSSCSVGAGRTEVAQLMASKAAASHLQVPI